MIATLARRAAEACGFLRAAFSDPVARRAGAESWICWNGDERMSIEDEERRLLELLLLYH